MLAPSWRRSGHAVHKLRPRGGPAQANRRREPRHAPLRGPPRRWQSSPSAAPEPEQQRKQADDAPPDEQQGAMSRRLAEMTDATLEANPRRSAKLVEEAGFSEELRRRLEARIAAGAAEAEHPQAASLVGMPASAGRGTRDVAEAAPWTGAEKLEDAALRMLTDAHKPLRGQGRPRPAPKLPPIDTRLKAPRRGSPAERLANARDRTSIYALAQDAGMSDREKEEMRRVLKERFQPGARPMPASIQGLQSLASERIEDAIARGLFKNIPRGKGVNVERDHAASSPFLDTTEYFMNKIIQKQEVLPPWVEKQQELTHTAATFRARLRNDWKRHAARVIASRGGDLQHQIRRAELYALAEARENPRPKKGGGAATPTIGAGGQLQSTLATETAAPAAHETIITTSTAPQDAAPPPLPSATADLATAPLAPQPTSPAVPTEQGSASPPAEQSASDPPPHSAPEQQSTTSTPPPVPEALPPPFRDPTWEATELSYHTLALAQLNSLARSYNLMAPELAKKPYFSLERELRACFGDVAPQLAAEIRERARAPPPKPGWADGSSRPPSASVLARLGAADSVRVWESTRPRYGLKEFWRDLFKGGSGG